MTPIPMPAITAITRITEVMKITADMKITATTAITETGKNVCPCAAVLQDAEKTSDSSEPEVFL